LCPYFREGASGLTDPEEELTGNPLAKGVSGMLESQIERTQELVEGMVSILTIQAGSHFPGEILVAYSTKMTEVLTNM
jgi:hypothetical protein